MREPLPRPLASSLRCDILNSFYSQQIACYVAYDVILILWDIYANNAARRGGGGKYSGNNNGQLCTLYYNKLFWLIKSIVAVGPNQENRNNFEKINQVCASLFNLKLFRSPFGFREKFRDEYGILFLFCLYFIWIQGKVS